ncbi:MAG TPA: TIGR03960 family B12-binding radical SAM protein [Bacillota bacterium]|nr:TIGR03960 family B12-binding radical SAM protein [Bacillota bacterium]
MNQRTIHQILKSVEKPSRYTGGEWGSIQKDWEKSRLRCALAYPDLYEVGESHLGLRLLYHRINDEQDFLAERVFAPKEDMERELRAGHLPLFSLESQRPVSQFDILGFTLQYELSYTNIINMLDLADIPIHTADRGDHDAFIIGGGPGAYNPEPIADFFDLFFLGEAEEGILEILNCVASGKAAGKNRKEIKRDLALIPGVYIPEFYRVTYLEDGRIDQIRPLPGIPPTVKKRVIADFDHSYLPTQQIVPYSEIVHDRIMMEIFRGCTRGCRFCQAGMVYRPVRERQVSTIENGLKELIKSTGYSEASLTSLSSSDYSMIRELVSRLSDCYSSQFVNITLPSLRIDAFPADLAERFQGGRKAGLTFAPEAGTDRLRRVINKGVTEEDMVNAAEAAFRGGWQRLKLYFMLGLPTETDEDLEGIAKMARNVLAIGKQLVGRRAYAIQVSVSVSTFVPKPHTPFQWRGQLDLAEVKRRQALLAEWVRGKGLELHWHDAETSFLEGVFSRGDRRLSAVIQEAWRLGCRFDGWTESFRFDLWMEAFKNTGIEPRFYANRVRDYSETLPWDHLDTGLDKRFLIEEDRRAEQAINTSDCRKNDCAGCGVCGALGVQTSLVGGDENA